MDHVIEHDNPDMYRCTMCGWQWRHKPDGACPGVRRYDTKAIPPQLKTRSELLRQGLQPLDAFEPDGCIFRPALGSYIWLYDEAQCVPSPYARPWQLAALERRRLEERTCRECGRVLESRDGLSEIASADGNGPTRLCSDCYANIRRAEGIHRM